MKAFKRKPLTPQGMRDFPLRLLVFCVSSKAVVSNEKGETFVNKSQMLDRLVDLLEQELLKEGQTSVFHLGQIKVRDRKERVGRNPKTGESLVIPQHKTLYLRVSDTMHRRLSELP